MERGDCATLDKFEQSRLPDRFVLVKRSKKYQSGDRFPKVSIRRELYDQLAQIASESGLSMSELTSRAISFSLERLSWADE